MLIVGASPKRSKGCRRESVLYYSEAVREVNNREK